jgi:hypothetical protein
LDFLSSLVKSETKSASQAAAVESAMGFGRSFGWPHLRNA